jgi:cysteine-rich repeat protein
MVHVPESQGRRSAGRSGLPFAVAVLLLLASGAAEAQPWRPGIRRPEGFQSGPRSGDAREVAERFIRERHRLLGIETEDLGAWRLGDRVVSRHSGITHLYLKQQLGGIDVRGGDLTVNVMPDGRILGLRHRFVRRLTRAANAREERITARQAVRRAAEHLGLALTGPLEVLERAGGPARKVLFGDGGISREPIPAGLVFLREGDESMRLAWELFVYVPDEEHRWNLAIDAISGEVLSQVDWIVHDSYNVFPFPLESPDDGPRSVEVDPSAPGASPLGWHDDDGVPGADHTTTVGNNVIAREDLDGNNMTTGDAADGGATRDFDFPLDLLQAPSASQDVALTNVFYWSNLLHDIHYSYGFDEASGNFQNDNYGNGGLQGDPVLADVLDGSGINNANFSRAADGFPPRMQMYVWRYPGLEVTAPGSLAQLMGGGSAMFGTPLSLTGTTGSLVMAEPADGCSALTNPGAISGNIALIDRGSCNFTVKVANAQAAGALAAVIVNNQGGEAIPMGGSDPAVTLRSLFIGQGHGQILKDALGSGVTVRLTSRVERDGDLDSTLIAHEYGHGVSIRLSGGASDAGCLADDQSAGMGEGWSDWWALVLTTTAEHRATDPRPIAAWASGEGPDGLGIRNFRYTTDISANPQTLSTISATNPPHGVGEVWALGLWEMYWLLVANYGFDPDWIGGTGGNNLALQLVMDALKIQGCQPTFLDARDALFDADLATNGGANECLLWQAFAKRGMGEDAVVSANPNVLSGVSDGFSVPAGCEPVCGNGWVDLEEACDDGGVAPGDGCSATCQPESSIAIFGDAQGGSVSVTLAGEEVTIPTSLGDTASQVRQALVDAINANSILTGLGISAQVLGSQVVVDGEVSGVSLDDPGLSETPPPVSVPALGPGGIALAIAALALAGLGLPRRCPTA